VLADICKRIGIDPQEFLAGISEQTIKDQLKANTDEVDGARRGSARRPSSSTRPTCISAMTGCADP